MAYNLPKAWSSPYAYPKYVLDEGLERFPELADGALPVDYPQSSHGPIG